MREVATTLRRATWYMQVVDVRLGHQALGFDYPMDGDLHPRHRSTQPAVQDHTNGRSER